MFKKLNEEKVDYLVVGGVALVLHGAVRFTADLDLMIMPKAQNLQKVVSTLKSLGYKPKLPQLPKDLSFDMLKEWKDTRNLQVLSFYNSANSLDLIDVLIDPVVDYKKANEHKKVVNIKGVDIPLMSTSDLRRICDKERGIPKEQLEHFVYNTTPEMRLKWLEEAMEFVRKFVYPKHKAYWEKINSNSQK